MATRNTVLLNLEKDIEKLESFLEDYQTMREEITKTWDRDKPLFAEDLQETILEREKQIMEDLSSLYIEKEKLAKSGREQEHDE